jgi:elongator complex protein 1
MSNYHYYLKQELLAPEKASSTVMCSWHSERPLSVAMATPGRISLIIVLCN